MRTTSCLSILINFPLPLRWCGTLEVRELLLEGLDVLKWLLLEEFFFLQSRLSERKKREREKKKENDDMNSMPVTSTLKASTRAFYRRRRRKHRPLSTHVVEDGTRGPIPGELGANREHR